MFHTKTRLNVLVGIIWRWWEYRGIRTCSLYLFQFAKCLIFLFSALKVDKTTEKNRRNPENQMFSFLYMKNSINQSNQPIFELCLLNTTLWIMSIFKCVCVHRLRYKRYVRNAKKGNNQTIKLQSYESGGSINVSKWSCQKAEEEWNGKES